MISNRGLQPRTSRSPNHYGPQVESYSSPNESKKRILTLETGGFGIVVEESAEAKKRRTEEEVNYRLFRNQNDEENYKYVEESKSTKLKEISDLNLIEEKLSNSTMNNNSAEIGSDYIPLFKEEIDENDRELYQRYSYSFENQEYKSNQTKLKIFANKYDILYKLVTNNVLIIQGNTGCGKTTQVPQYIFDDCRLKNKKCNIIVTQPRRLAAISIANRVCSELNCQIGSLCGYKIARESKVSTDTRICFVTTGYLLKLAIGNMASLKSFTHIILDEIHDREIDTDLILLIVKMIMKGNYKGKLILMSATLNPESLIEYFREISINESGTRSTSKSQTEQPTSGSMSNKTIDVVNCKNEMHEVKQFYLKGLEKLIKKSFSSKIFQEPKMHPEMIELTGELLKYLDEKEAENNNGLSKINGFLTQRGSVLIFVSGMDAIREVERYLKHNLDDRQLNILPLHSDIPVEQQMEVFKRASGGYRKVIIATNIAESSITVDDIKYVIDFCLTKALHWDPETNIQELVEEWASKSNLDQRKGRAGRTGTGACYRLIPENFKISDYSKPDIDRVPLQKMILDIKRLNCDDKPKILCSHLLTPPKQDKIDRAILILKETGALTLLKKRGFVSTMEILRLLVK